MQHTMHKVAYVDGLNNVRLQLSRLYVHCDNLIADATRVSRYYCPPAVLAARRPHPLAPSPMERGN